MKIAIFASGSGSNAEALIQKAQTLSGVSVEFVLSDRKNAGVLERAHRLQVRSYLVEKTGSRDEHETMILSLVDEHRVDWIFLAGYMRLIGPAFLKSLKSRHGGQRQILNIHPSLLPAYPGTDSISKAFQDRVKESGVSIHHVDEGMDTGPMLVQRALTLGAEETLESFTARTHQLEHALYTQVLEDIATQKISTVTYSRES